MNQGGMRHPDHTEPSPFWDERLPAARQEVYAPYRMFDNMRFSGSTVWKEVDGQVELALHLLPDSLHRLPFSPTEYVEVALSLRCIEFWQLLFIPEDEQLPYAEIIGHTAHYIRQLFPDAAHLIPAHVTARFPRPEPVPGPDYRQRLEVALQQLAALPGIKVKAEPLPAGASLGVRFRAERALGRPLPAELLAFYAQVNGCHIRWQGPRGKLKGSLALRPLEQAMGGRRYSSNKHWDATVNEGEAWAEGHMEYVVETLREEGQDVELPASGLKLFDEVGTTSFGAISLAADAEEPAKLWWLVGDDLDDLRPLRLSFAQYLDKLLGTLGLEDWQFHFLRDEPAPPYAEHVRQDLQHLNLSAAILA